MPTDLLTFVFRADVTTLDVHVRSREVLDAMYRFCMAHRTTSVTRSPEWVLSAP